MKLLPFRDYNGWLIPASKKCILPLKGDGLKKTRGGEVIARYIFCPEWNTMMHVYVCKKCKFFAGYEPHGLKCKSKTINEPPQWYNELQMTKKEKNGKDKLTNPNRKRGQTDY